VEGCYGVRPTYTDESVFVAAHERLDGLLEGDGTLAARYARWRYADRVPAERVERGVAAVIEEARAWTRALVDLPEGEGVVLEIVRDKPWLAFCEYQGDLRSHISINVDMPINPLLLVQLTVHETYAGHHVERVCKELLLVQNRGLLEETLVLVPTPQSLLAEGIAEVAAWSVRERAPQLSAVLEAALGIEVDLTHDLAVAEAIEPCGWADVNAALMLHGDGASEAEVRAFLERWTLRTPELVDHALRFMTDPTSRSYVPTYATGYALCRPYVEGSPERLRRLLTEQVRVGELLAATDA
jgi:hypothetical protein